MENSLLVIFGEIWPKSLYYSTGTLARFLKIHKKNLDWNQGNPVSRTHTHTHTHTP